MIVSNYSSQNRSNVYFGHNQGVLKALKNLKTDLGNGEYVAELQVQLQDIELTQAFKTALSKESDSFKKLIVKFAPKEFKEPLREFLGVQ